MIFMTLLVAVVPTLMNQIPRVRTITVVHIKMVIMALPVVVPVHVWRRNQILVLRRIIGRVEILIFGLAIVRNC